MKKKRGKPDETGRNEEEKTEEKNTENWKKLDNTEINRKKQEETGRNREKQEETLDIQLLAVEVKRLLNGTSKIPHMGDKASLNRCG